MTLDQARDFYSIPEAVSPPKTADQEEVEGGATSSAPAARRYLGPPSTSHAAIYTIVPLQMLGGFIATILGETFWFPTDHEARSFASAYLAVMSA